MNFLVHTVKIVHVSFSKCVFLFKLSRTMQSELFHVPEETKTYSLFTMWFKMEEIVLQSGGERRHVYWWLGRKAGGQGSARYETGTMQQALHTTHNSHFCKRRKNSTYKLFFVRSFGGNILDGGKNKLNLNIFLLQFDTESVSQIFLKS